MIVTIAVSLPRPLASVYVKVSVGGLIVSAGGVYVKAPVGLRSTLPPPDVVVAKAESVPKLTVSLARTPLSAGTTRSVLAVAV